MSPKEGAQSLVVSVQEWARDLFATRADTPSRREYEQRHAQLEAQMTERAQGVIDTMNKRVDSLRELHVKDIARMEETRQHELELVRKDIDDLQEWKANITGRTIGLGILGAIFIAVVASLITHLVGGG